MPYAAFDTTKNISFYGAFFHSFIFAAQGFNNGLHF